MSKLTFLLAGAALAFAVGCSGDPHTGAPITTKQTRPQDVMAFYGCPTCHVIPGVPGAVGKVGPPLTALSQRSFIAGNFPNTPENVQQWIMHPQHYRPGSAMPEMNVSPQDAAAIVNYLYTR